MRLDKYLTTCTKLSRKEAKAAIGRKKVTVNGETAVRPEQQVEETDEVCLDGEQICYCQYEYYMLNKPAGVVSATMDNRDTTVVELLDGVSSKELFPVGRLDKDTEGLLVLTNDGPLAHKLLSPKYHVDKTYYVEVDKTLSEEDVTAFLQGMDIGEKRLTQPADLKILSEHSAHVTIREGKFHQIKRMFLHQGKSVTYLKRISMGELVLDEALKPGEYRPLTDDELAVLKGNE